MWLYQPKTLNFPAEITVSMLIHHAPATTPDELVRPSDISAMLPVSAITRRPYTLTCIYRWLRRGRLTVHRCDGKIRARYSDVMDLALDLSGRRHDER
jgi:hypothetical protein